MKYLALCFAAGFVLGILVVYIWQRRNVVGSLLVYEDEETISSGMGPSIFLELEVELEKFRGRKNVSLRVENRSYYENQNT